MNGVIMSDTKFSAFWALVVVAITFFVFCINFWVIHGNLPGYIIFVYPGIATTRLFSEEIAYWPKLSIMLTGQYLAYFVMFLMVKKLSNFIKTR
jgi:hypothetical protein